MHFPARIRRTFAVALIVWFFSTALAAYAQIESTDRARMAARTQIALEALAQGKPAEALPAGWIDFRGEGEDRVPCLIQIPARWDPEAAGVLIALPPRGEDAEQVIVGHGDLVRESLAQGWMLVVAEMPWDGIASGTQTAEALLRAIRGFIEERLSVRVERLGLIGLGESLPEAFTQAIRFPGEYRVFGCLNGVWDPFRSRQSLLDVHDPLPAMFFAVPDRDPWSQVSADLSRIFEARTPFVFFPLDEKDEASAVRAMLAFFGQQSVQPDLRRLAVSEAALPPWRDQWLSLRQVSELGRDTLIAGDVLSTNSLAISTRNVLVFDLILSAVPDLVAGRPIEIEVDQQRLQVFSQELPQILRLEFREVEDRPGHWAAMEASSDASPGHLAELRRDLLPAPAADLEEADSVARLAARAARQAAGQARLALIPARAIESGQPKGPIHLADVSRWIPDAELSTASLPAPLVIAALDRDFRGEREIVTDGLDAVLLGDGGILGVDEPGETPSAPESGPAGNMAFQTSLSELDELVVVGWKSLLERSESWLGIKIDPTHLHPVPVGQREAIVSLFTAHPVLPELGPDIRSPAHKKAQPIKTRP